MRQTLFTTMYLLGPHHTVHTVGCHYGGMHLYLFLSFYTDQKQCLDMFLWDGKPESISNTGTVRVELVL